MNIMIRKMNLDDIPYVYEEEIKIFGKSLGEETLYEDIMHNDMAKYFIALVDNKRAGYVGCWLTIPNADILNIFVASEYRGLGIGKLLMKEVIYICKENNIKTLILEVNENNRYAIKMYQDLGFVVGSVRKRYYDNNEDALLMMLELGGIA